MKRLSNVCMLAGLATLIGGVGTSFAAWDTSNVPVGGLTPAQLETVDPSNTGIGDATAVSAIAVTGVNTGATNGRMAALRSEKIYADMGLSPVGPAGPTSTGNVLEKPGVWGVFVGTWADQDDINGQRGFEYDTYGFMYGSDIQLSGDWIIGINAGYAETDVDSGLNTEIEIDTYTVGLYSSYSVDLMYIDYGAMYSFNDIDIKRQVNNLGTIENVTGYTSSDVLTLYAEMGCKHRYDNLILNPFLGVQQSSVDTDGYGERGSSLAMVVGDSDDEFFSSTLGVRGEFFVDQALYLKGRLAWNHQYSDDLRHATNARFVGGGTFFTTEGIDLGQNHYTIGLGMKYMISSALSLNVDYDLDMADEFDAHTGRIGVKYTF